MNTRHANKRWQMIWGLCLIKSEAVSINLARKGLVNSSKLDCAKFKPKDDSNVHSDEVPLQTTVGKLQCFVKMQCSLLWIK